jgi:hypothetical protein
MGASGFGDIEPGTFLNLYRIAHSELTVDKWDNSISLPIARRHCAAPPRGFGHCLTRHFNRGRDAARLQPALPPALPFSLPSVDIHLFGNRLARANTMHRFRMYQ